VPAAHAAYKESYIMAMTVFNTQNTDWKDNTYSIFLGQAPGLYDSINVKYPKLFKIYKQQVSQRWVEDEFNHDQSRLDFIKCPESVYKIMILNLAFQWELDSVASRASAPLFAPFVTCSEAWAAMMENANMEIIHSLTYSEIIRLCIKNPSEIFEMIMNTPIFHNRAAKVSQVFEDLARVGAEYTLGLRKNDQETYNYVFKGMFALYVLERLQFMSSFAATFAIVEQGFFQSIGKAVQKIMIDELACHAEFDSAVLHAELKTERGQIAFESMKDELCEMIEEVVRQEFAWTEFLFEDGRSIVGLTPNLLNEWVVSNAQAIYKDLRLPNPRKIVKNPLAWMSNWINIDKFQNANQEADNNNYALNVIKDDLGDDVIEFDF
jgi:ribonucleoside-diphosphate reductase beta chain